MNDLKTLETRVAEISRHAMVPVQVKEALGLMMAWVKEADQRLKQLERGNNGEG
jgi:hypothetical protein